MENLGLGGMQESAQPTPGSASPSSTTQTPSSTIASSAWRGSIWNTRKFDFTPMGRRPPLWASCLFSPGQEDGLHDDYQRQRRQQKRCEFWGIDLVTTRLSRSVPPGKWQCRAARVIALGMSSSGQQLYIYAAELFQIEVYDAVTFKQLAVSDLNHDMTGPMVVLP